jgi:hypothetical protein
LNTLRQLRLAANRRRNACSAGRATPYPWNRRGSQQQRRRFQKPATRNPIVGRHKTPSFFAGQSWNAGKPRRRLLLAYVGFIMNS